MKAWANFGKVIVSIAIVGWGFFSFFYPGHIFLTTSCLPFWLNILAYLTGMAMTIAALSVILTNAVWKSELKDEA